MSGSPTDWSAMRAAALPIVREAAGRIAARQGDLGTVEKAPHDFVTQLDIDIEAFLIDALGTAFPGHAVVGEESFEGLAGGEQPVWVVDPLDGTANVVHGLTHHAVSVALLHRGAPVVGIVCDPVHGEVFDGAAGAGAHLNGNPLLLAAEPPSKAPIGASSGFLLHWTQHGGGHALVELLRGHGKFRILGSQALQLCYVAAGRLKANFSQEAKLWDDAAGALIVAEAGGRYGTWVGEDIFPVTADSPAGRGKGLRSLAAGPGAWEEIVALLQQEVRPS